MTANSWDSAVEQVAELVRENEELKQQTVKLNRLAKIGFELLEESAILKIALTLATSGSAEYNQFLEQAKVIHESDIEKELAKDELATAKQESVWTREG